MKQLRRLPWLGLSILLVMVLAAVVGPDIWPQDALKQNYSQLYAPPSAEHPLGTDNLGRDVLARVLLGGRISLTIAGLATLGALSMGLILGLLAGGRGSVLDIILTRVSDALLAFPGFLLVLLVVVILGNGQAQTIAALAVGGTPAFFRLTRGYTRSILGTEYVTAARALGARQRRILPRHVLPNIVGPLIVQAASVAAVFLLVEASLSFLGLGIAPPTPTWGNVLQDARSYLTRQPWAAVGPGIFLAAASLSFQFLSDGLRDLLDSRT